MNIALILAGGSGQRTYQDIPKQFINVRDKPIIMYTLEAFQRHLDIDAIQVVCLEGWHDILKAYAKQFNITKLVGVVSGGESGQASIRNGLLAISERFDDDDVVLVHDGVRPMVSAEIISDSIAKCKLHGSAIAAIPCVEAMLETSDKISSKSTYDRDRLMRTQTPQSFPIGKLMWAHQEARTRGIDGSVASCTLMVELGQKVYFSAGSEKNIKITTAEDIEIFQSLLTIEKPDWLK